MAGQYVPYGIHAYIATITGIDMDISPTLRELERCGSPHTCTLTVCHGRRGVVSEARGGMSGMERA